MEFIPAFYDKHTKIWSGEKNQPFYHPDCSIGKVIFNTLKNHPDNVVQISDSEGTTLTNSECVTAAIRIAQHLKKMGLRHDDVIGIVGRNTHYLLPLGVACLFNATPFHAVNATYDEKTLTHIFAQTKPKVIFCDGQDYKRVHAATKAFQPLFYTLIDHIDGVPKLQDLLEPTKTEFFYRPQPLTIGEEQTMAILCSSGTTGMPKSVCLSNCHLFLATDHILSTDVVYSSSALDWVSGLWVGITVGTRGCTRVITTKPYSAELFVELVHKYKITVALVAPRHVATIIKCPTATPANMASIKMLGIGGGGMALATLQAMQDIIKNGFVSFGYASTEIGGVTINFGLTKSNSVGKLAQGLRMRIVDESGNNLGPNEVGEILCNNDKPWNGYYSNPLETQRMRDAQGWFHSGDLGYFDDDKFLYVVDRVKDICKYNGMQFWPSEIEDCICEIPGVADACVVGIYDESVGDKAAALVVKSPDSKLTEKDVKDYVAKKLVLAHKQLNAGVLFVEKLPENNNGKKLKREAKIMFEQSIKDIDH